MVALRYNVVVEWTKRIIAQYSMPLTVRQIYYRIISTYTQIPNNRSSYNAIDRQLVKARERGDVDDAKIVDRSRTTFGGDDGYDNPEDFVSDITLALQGSNKRYRRTLWASQPYYLEVWVEKDALSQLIERAVNEFRVVIAPSRGYGSYTYLKDAAQRFNGRNNEVRILHFADHDPSGLDMTRDLQERLSRYSQAPVEVHRIALTYDQVRAYGLPSNPTKAADSRSPRYVNQYGNECWELDAIPPDELTRLVREAVSSQIDTVEWQRVLLEEAQERAQLKARFERAAKVLAAGDGA